MKNALINDIAQRVLTLNKWEQRASLRSILTALPHGSASRALDFGCGTGLFIPTIHEAGFHCTGLDIDPELTAYAARLYPRAQFVNSLGQLADQRFDVILANCCFHHIADDDLGTILTRFRELLAPGGRLLVIDILDSGKCSVLHGLFMKMEKGKHIRMESAIKDAVSRHFAIIHAGHEFGGVFSIRWRANPFGNERLLLECR